MLGMSPMLCSFLNRLLCIVIFVIFSLACYLSRLEGLCVADGFSYLLLDIFITLYKFYFICMCSRKFTIF